MIDQEALLFMELEILKEMDEESVSTLYSTMSVGPTRNIYCFALA